MFPAFLEVGIVGKLSPSFIDVSNNKIGRLMLLLQEEQKETRQAMRVQDGSRHVEPKVYYPFALPSYIHPLGNW